MIKVLPGHPTFPGHIHLCKVWPAGLYFRGILSGSQIYTKVYQGDVPSQRYTRVTDSCYGYQGHWTFPKVYQGHGYLLWIPGSWTFPKVYQDHGDLLWIPGSWIFVMDTRVMDICYGYQGHGPSQGHTRVTGTCYGYQGHGYLLWIPVSQIFAMGTRVTDICYGYQGHGPSQRYTRVTDICYGYRGHGPSQRYTRVMDVCHGILVWCTFSKVYQARPHVQVIQG